MTGHLKRDCRVNLNKRGVLNNGAGNSSGGSNGSTSKEGQIISNLDNSMNYVCLLIPESLYVEDDDCAWWVDSGATSHICRDHRWFEKLTPIDDESIVKMDDVTSSNFLGN